MIYSIYEKFIELTENYKIWDYLTYIIFIVFVVISSLLAVSYAHVNHDSDLNRNSSSYIISTDD